ncbi:hypothetical protein ACFOW6_12075 [Fodinicurvata halophila]|uniref:Metallo-beta-lactamase domain-containing protein n=1 Tax=Fodinicurvata halophila TaxID=1419723 RepID=A0ABV8UN52_9PROT
MIQIDMFEVKLGAALLLRFGTKKRPINVLADGGVSRWSGYPPDHVHKKLKQVFNSDEFCLHLIIGTHYDEDHLNGLVPIINDTSITIYEAWMPPVVNDLDQRTSYQDVSKEGLLPHQFTKDVNNTLITSYLKEKYKEINICLYLEKTLKTELTDINEFYHKVNVNESYLHELSFFREQIEDSYKDNYHSDVDFDTENDNIDEYNYFRNIPKIIINKSYYHHNLNDLKEIAKHLYFIRRNDPKIALMIANSYAAIRKNSAKRAINAKALHNVVQALRKRSIPIQSKIIDDGTPQKYWWNTRINRFTLSPQKNKEPTFTLLGPSQSLVNKHLHKIPTYDLIKMASEPSIEIRRITESNELSYIGCFDFLGQRILISGDAGCVDFLDDKKNYYKDLLKELETLHIVQVAHHGGNNAYFYDVLNKAGYPNQNEPSYMLLSHDYHDKLRPSHVFESFLVSALSKGKNIQILFTSEPRKKNVNNYKRVIFPPTGTKSHTVGDVKIRFDPYSGWIVDNHAIKIT